MTGFADPPDRDKTGDAGEDLVDSSTGAPSRRIVDQETANIADIRVIASTLADTDPVRQWLNEYADLLDRGVGQIRIDDADDIIADIEVMIANASVAADESQAKADRRKSHSEQMMVRSGNVHDPRPLVAFLYFLARDVVPVGDIESILIRLRELESDLGEYGFTNGWIARWAQDASERLGVTRNRQTLLGRASKGLDA